MKTAAPSIAPVSRGTQHVRDRGLSILFALLAVVMLICLTVPEDILAPLDQKDPAAAMAQPKPVMRMIKLVLLFSGAAIMLARNRQTARLLKHTNRFFIAFLILVPLSYVWSISRPATLARFISIASIVSIATGFCLVGWHPRRFQNVVRTAVTLLLAGSIALYLYNPELAIEQGEGTLKNAWHGIAAQKNVFGMVSSMGVIFWVHATLSREVGILRGLAGTALAFTCVVFSHSSTSILATLLCCFFLLLCVSSPRPLRRFMPYLIGSFVVLVLLYALIILHLVPGLDVLLIPITHLTGKDTTFSNRTAIWQIIQDHISLSPILGSGYGAYWIGPLPTSPSYIFLSQLWFYPTESHNGYLEITNDLGFVGLTILFGYLIQFTRGSLEVLRVNRTQGALYLALFGQQAIMNLSESCWLEINSGPILPIMIMSTMALARTLQEQRSAARAARAARAAAAGVTATRSPPPRARRPGRMLPSTAPRP
jgi:O-antigen ligase